MISLLLICLKRYFLFLTISNFVVCNLKPLKLDIVDDSILFTNLRLFITNFSVIINIFVSNTTGVEVVAVESACRSQCYHTHNNLKFDTFNLVGFYSKVALTVNRRLLEPGRYEFGVRKKLLKLFK